MKLKDMQITSTRGGARLDVTLRSTAGLHLSQTDKFDTPYNEGIPPEYHREVANHWHVTAETVTMAADARIGAVMSVSGPADLVEVQILEHPGWFGAKAIGNFGETIGWVQLQAGSPGPAGFGAAVDSGKAVICGVTGAGQLFSAA